MTPDTVLTSSISVPGLHKLRAEREQVRPLSAWEEEIFDTLATWAETGCPDDAVSYPPAVEGRHTLPGNTLQLALDSIAKFIDKGEFAAVRLENLVQISFPGFIFGPINPRDWPLEKAPHCIGIFTREQKSSESVRVIYDCSAPRTPEGSDINSHNNPDTRLKYPFSMSTPNDIIRTVFNHGAKAELSVLRADLSDAYKNLAVTRSVLHKQTIKLAGVYFIDSRLLFGVSVY